MPQQALLPTTWFCHSSSLAHSNSVPATISHSQQSGFRPKLLAPSLPPRKNYCPKPQLSQSRSFKESLYPCIPLKNPACCDIDVCHRWPPYARPTSVQKCNAFGCLLPQCIARLCQRASFLHRCPAIFNLDQIPMVPFIPNDGKSQKKQLSSACQNFHSLSYPNTSVTLSPTPK